MERENCVIIHNHAALFITYPSKQHYNWFKRGLLAIQCLSVWPFGCTMLNLTAKWNQSWAWKKKVQGEKKTGKIVSLKILCPLPEFIKLHFNFRISEWICLVWAGIDSSSWWKLSFLLWKEGKQGTVHDGLEARKYKRNI